MARKMRLTLGAAVVGMLVTASQISAKGSQHQSEAELSRRIDALIDQMTVEEKAAQLQVQFVMPMPGGTTPDQRAEKGVGAFLFISDPAEANRLQRMAMEKSRLRIPLLFAYDINHGLATIFPVPIASAASWDPAMVERNEAIAAREGRAVGIHWTFGPVADIARDPRWGRIVEGPGEDPYLASAIVSAQVRGFQGPRIGTPGRLIAGPKHFAGYGAALGGRDFDEANVSDADLWNIHLPPFKAAIDAGAGNIMTAYMALNGIPASGNRWLLTEVLRDQWGFKGWVVSDNEAVKNLRTHGLSQNSQQSAQIALAAGVDMEMTFANSAFSNLPKALAERSITTQQLDTAVRRILEAKLRMGLFEHPYVDAIAATKILRAPQHLQAAQLAAERSAVLLKNENGLLPLDRDTVSSIAVIGTLADSPRDPLGAWVFPQNNPVKQTILAGIREKLGTRVKVTYSPGVAMAKRLYPSPFEMMEKGPTRPAPQDDTSGIAEAVSTARAADATIVVVGEGHEMIGEGGSRSSLDLPGRQQELLDAVVATGKPVVVVLMNGRPLDLKETKAQAILDIWYPGSRGGAATANLLFGDAVPGGKLPFTWPRNAAQLPIYYSRLTSHDPRNADRRYWNEPNSPAYPFGHGLSYTSFSYSNLRVTPATIVAGQSVTVSVDLKNTGSHTGDEVAQLYVHQKAGTAARPIRELKGFQRISLKPGAMRTLTFTLGPNELRYWNAAKRESVIDTAEFDLAVGGDSTAPFAATFSVVAPRQTGRPK